MAFPHLACALRSICMGSPVGCGGWLGAGLGLVPVGRAVRQRARQDGVGCPTARRGGMGAQCGTCGARDERIERGDLLLESRRECRRSEPPGEFQAPPVLQMPRTVTAARSAARREPRCGTYPTWSISGADRPARRAHSSAIRGSWPLQAQIAASIWPCRGRSAAPEIQEPRSGAGDGAPGASDLPPRGRVSKPALAWS